MKKIVLILIFIFSFSSLSVLNANTLSKNQTMVIEPYDCTARAWEKADELNEYYISTGGPGYSNWNLWDLTEYYYEKCLGNQQ